MRPRVRRPRWPWRDSSCGTQRDYVERHPRGDETLLVVEVSVTTLEDDRLKARTYAAGGTPVYWIVDVVGRRVIVHERPLADGYGEVRVVEEGGDIEVPGTTIRWTVAEVLGT